LSESGSLPSGVTFTDNGDGTATLAGTPASGSDGSYPFTITASNGISPDATQSFTLTVDEVPATSTSLASSANPSTTGQKITYTATVSPTPDGGTMAFAEHGVTLDGCGEVALSTSTGTATCTVSYGSAGSHAIQATYSGDASFAGSHSSTMTEVVTERSTAKPRSTTTAVHASPNSAVTGERVTYTAAVTPTPDGGTVTFLHAGKALAGCGAVPIDTASGTARCTTSYPTSGREAVQAFYSGDADFARSQSSAVAERVVWSLALRDVRSTAAGGVRFTVRCASGSGGCRVTGKLTYRGGHGQTSAAGIKTVDLSAGSTRAIAIQLNHAGRQLLAGRDKLSVQLTISLTVDGQTSEVASRNLTIHPPPKS